MTDAYLTQVVKQLAAERAERNRLARELADLRDELVSVREEWLDNSINDGVSYMDQAAKQIAAEDLADRVMFEASLIANELPDAAADLKRAVEDYNSRIREIEAV